ncbi:hypothetical protein Cantr_09947 [Candida viswanathii]|uniref:Uncharacterized protein n=1 Tax=Candida viswanathii TaxID=5486 RepID=A0A367YCS2_9ASCO|nr:hypothetical protein Cantr_09947 [Candida viswanathii]
MMRVLLRYLVPVSQLDQDEEVKLKHLQPLEVMPTITEATTHLKLLKGFGEIKKRVLHSYKESYDLLEIYET